MGGGNHAKGHSRSGTEGKEGRGRRVLWEELHCPAEWVSRHLLLAPAPGQVTWPLRQSPLRLWAPYPAASPMWCSS